MYTRDRVTRVSSAFTQTGDAGHTVWAKLSSILTVPSEAKSVLEVMTWTGPACKKIQSFRCGPLQRQSRWPAQPTLPRQSSYAVRNYKVAGLEAGHPGIRDRHDAVAGVGFNSGLGGLVDKGDVKVAIAVAWRVEQAYFNIRKAAASSPNDQDILAEGAVPQSVIRAHVEVASAGLIQQHDHSSAVGRGGNALQMTGNTAGAAWDVGREDGHRLCQRRAVQTTEGKGGALISFIPAAPCPA